MKRLLLATLLITGFISGSFGQTSSTDFRSFAWGASFNDVQTNEKSDFLIKDKNDMLQYKDKLAGYDCDVVYSFNENDKLISGNYIFTKRYTNPQIYLQDYSTFKKLLTQKYGKPNSDKLNWSNNASSSEKHNYGLAIVDGSLTLTTVWTTERSIVQIVLISFNRIPSLHIHYTAKSLDELQNGDELQKALKKL